MDQKSPGFRGSLAVKKGLGQTSQGGEVVFGRLGVAYSRDSDSFLRDDAAPVEAAQSVSSAAVLFGVWIEDDRAAHFDTNIQTFEELHQVIASNEQRGFRPVDIFGSGRFFEPWSVAFVEDDAPGNVWQITTDPSAFRQRHEDMLRQGYRLAAFNRRHRNFNAVWEPVPVRAQPVAWNMSWSELMALDKRQRDRGLRIAVIDRYGTSGVNYAAAWEPGEGEQMVEAPGALNAGIQSSLSAMAERYTDAGLFVQAIGHNEHAIVVYRSDVPDAKRRFACLPIARFHAYDQICRNAGYRLACISHANWPGSGA